MIAKSVCAFGMLFVCALGFGQRLIKNQRSGKAKGSGRADVLLRSELLYAAHSVDVTKTANASTPEGAAMQLLEAMPPWILIAGCDCGPRNRRS